MNRFISILLGIFILSEAVTVAASGGPNGAPAQKPGEISTQTKAVVANPNGDFFYNGTRFTLGKHAGELIDVKLKRALVDLEGTEFAKTFPSRPGYRLVGNIVHNKEMWIGYIPVDSAQNVRFLMEPFGFGGVMAHSMLRFQMDPNKPVELVGKVPLIEGAMPTKLDQPIMLNDLLITIEVTLPIGQRSFSPVKGFFKYYGFAVRVTSLTGRGVRQYLSRADLVHQIPLNFDPQETQTTLQTALNSSIKRGMHELYHTFTDNCNVGPFEYLESARPLVGGKQSFCEARAGEIIAVSRKLFPMSLWYPPAARFVLTTRGYYVPLLSPRSTLMNDDPDFLSLAATYPGLEENPCGPVFGPKPETPAG